MSDYLLTQIRAIEERVQNMEARAKSRFSGARVYRTTNKSILDSTITAIDFDAERYDTDNYHSTVSNTTRFTAPKTGKYHIGGAIVWDANATGRRQLSIRLNGSATLGIQQVAAVSSIFPPAQVIGVDYQLNAGQYIELRVYQDSTITIDILSTAALSPEFWIHFLG